MWCIKIDSKKKIKEFRNKIKSLYEKIYLQIRTYIMVSLDIITTIIKSIYYHLKDKHNEQK